ncbi:hypothetical protein M885DRAFT_618514 [Pelagophyceae sp. CCMP2097]|nr:hypothetical protein M885DRAFT_618514 [Pelagophyceae sp. CCMP2097]
MAVISLAAPHDAAHPAPPELLRRDSFDLLALTGTPVPRHQRKSWIVLPSSFLLAGCAGCTNAVGLLGGLAAPGLPATGVSHVTGSATKIGIYIALPGDGGVSAAGIAALARSRAFMFGATISGTMTPTGVFALANLPIYGNVLIVVASMLFGAVTAAEIGWYGLAIVLAAAAAGAQNGIVTTASTCIVRTTHMTGIATDLSLIFGRVLRRLALKESVWLTHAEFKRGRLLLMLASGFISGAAVGAAVLGVAHVKNARTLLGPAVLQLCMGLAAKFTLCASRLAALRQPPPKVDDEEVAVEPVHDLEYLVTNRMHPFGTESPRTPGSRSRAGSRQSEEAGDCHDEAAQQDLDYHVSHRTHSQSSHHSQSSLDIGDHEYHVTHRAPHIPLMHNPLDSLRSHDRAARRPPFEPVPDADLV